MKHFVRITFSWWICQSEKLVWIVCIVGNVHIITYSLKPSFRPCYLFPFVYKMLAYGFVITQTQRVQCEWWIVHNAFNEAIKCEYFSPLQLIFQRLFLDIQYANVRKKNSFNFSTVHCCSNSNYLFITSHLRWCKWNRCN